MFKKSLAMVALSALLSAAPAGAREPDWQLLGEQTVGFLVDRDVINVNQSDEWHRNRAFKALHFQVERNDVHFESVRLIYVNGYAESITVDRLVRAGEEVPIDLRGERSFISRIEMAYRSRPNFRDQAVVRVMAEPARRGASPPPLPPVAREGSDWQPLGEQSVGFEGERDVIRIGRREGRFSRLRLEVRGNDVFVNSIRVRYGNGTHEDITLREEIRAGGRSRPIDLSGDRRVIDEIELNYRARPGFRGRATVAVLGDRASHAAPESSPPVPRADYSYPPDILSRFNNFGRRTLEPGEERVVFNVGSEREPQQTILLLAHDRPIEVRRIEVTYGNGQRQEFEINERLDPGTGTPPLDLEGSARKITRVAVFVRPNGRGAAQLQLMASQHDIERLRMERWRRRR